MRKRALQYLLVYICLVILAYCSSCAGTRKKSLQVDTFKSDVVLKEQKDITTNAEISVSEKESVYEPVDPEKPMTLPDGRITKNARVSDKEKKVDSVGQTLDKSRTDIGQKLDISKKALEIEVDKGNPYAWMFISGGIVVIVCFALYFARRWVNAKNQKNQ